jgi:DNA-binding IclR family transcriptional regulator
MKNKPTYSIASVDHALRLAELLTREGPLRVTDAAERLGVARSTAHRLLTMLVYRNFAEQDDDRRYVAGPVLRYAATTVPVDLKDLARPHLRELMQRVGETTNLSALEGPHVRFIVTEECAEILRVGDRGARILPAHLTSGGRAMLAAGPDEELGQRFAGTDVNLAALHRDLARVRRQGFAVNNQRTEAGVTAVGRALRGGFAAVAIAMPTARYDRARLPELVAHLTETTTAIDGQLT